jgi:DNA-binding transcriptional regulator GbsR (MarR family)
MQSPISNSSAKRETSPTDDEPRSLGELERAIIAYWVQIDTQLGYPRSIGEVFGYIFLSEQPVNADDLVDHLGISRSGAGQGIKTLLDIGAIRPAHNIANRREHFQMQSDLGVLVKQFLNVRVFPPLEELRRQRDALNETVAKTGNAHLKQRFDKLQNWQNKATPLISVLKSLIN